eukprot:6383864-Prymnesium_polylepis.1
MPRGRRLPALLAGGPASPAFAEFLSEAPAKVPQIDGNCELKKRPRGKPRGEIVAVLPDEIDHTPHKVKVSIGAERAEVGAARIQRPTRKPHGDQIAHSTGRAVAVAPTGHICDNRMGSQASGRKLDACSSRCLVGRTTSQQHRPAGSNSAHGGVHAQKLFDETSSNATVMSVAVPA